MAAKKTTAKKTTTKSKTAAGADVAPQDDASRPMAESPAPPEARLEPGTAMAEYLKSMVPADHPRLVFSTMALVGADEAVGIKHLKPGFSWNPQMDRLWALGFPKVKIIVDGHPADESKEALESLYRLDESSKNGLEKFCLTTLEGELLITRRAAFAFIHDTFSEDAAFELPEAKFFEVTTPRQLPTDELVAYLKCYEGKHKREESYFVLEALVGTERLVEAMMKCLVEADPNSEHGWADTLPYFLQRLPAATIARYEKTFDEVILPEGDRAELAELIPSSDLFPVEKTLAFAKKGSLVFPRKVFLAPVELQDSIAEHFASYDKMDGNNHQLQVHTGVRSTRMLAAQAQVLARKDGRAPMGAWFRAHRAYLESALRELALTDKRAAAALKLYR